MAENNNSVNDRLEQASQGGAPKLNPDEQRKYLGTFGERVSIVVPIKDMSNPKAVQAVKIDIQKHPNYVLLMNGQLDNDLIQPYMVLASQNNVQFELETDSFYFTKPDSYGVVFANKSEAINQYPKVWNKKYPQLFTQDKNKKTTTKSKKSSSFMSKLKHLF